VLLDCVLPFVLVVAGVVVVVVAVLVECELEIMSSHTQHLFSSSEDNSAFVIKCLLVRTATLRRVEFVYVILPMSQSHIYHYIKVPHRRTFPYIGMNTYVSDVYDHLSNIT
jgi:hypothetical protein